MLARNIRHRTLAKLDNLLCEVPVPTSEAQREVCMELVINMDLVALVSEATRIEIQNKTQTHVVSCMFGMGYPHITL